MALVGTDGNDLPDVMSNGVTSYDFISLNGRIFTEYQREPFLPNFGVGLVHLYRAPALSVGEIQTRLQTSFAGDPGYVNVETVDIAVSGGTVYTIDLDLEASSGSS